MNSKGFPLRAKDESGGSDDFYYAFVKLKPVGEEPDFWIIPSKKINEVLGNASRKYFNTLKNRKGESYNDVGIRRLDFDLGIDIVREKLYDPGWIAELKGYYKNLDQLI